MQRFLLRFLTLTAVAWTTSAPAQQASSPNRSVLEGTVRCSSRQPMVVYVETGEDAPVEPPSEPAVVDQRGLQFIPHVLPVLVGTRVAFLNSDPVHHNVFSTSAARPFNLGTYPTGVTRYVRFDRPGIVEVLCNVHPEMSAYVVVVETPYFVLTDEQGRYRLEDVPEGTQSVSVWCERHGTLQQQVDIRAPATALDLVMDRAGGGASESATRR